jgi:D-alanine-D-alanine ligase
MKKIRVAILFGGKSAEHEVSIQSARNIFQAIDREKYEIVLIGIDRDGSWYLNESSRFLLDDRNPDLVALNKTSEPLAMVPGSAKDAQLLATGAAEKLAKIDVVFPVLHGPMGEDGTVQGMLKLAGIPFVGAGVFGSAAGMDKDFMKKLLQVAGLPVAKAISLSWWQRDQLTAEQVERELGFPCFIKPANMGSSVGVHKVHDAGELSAAVADAFQYDTKILIEEFIIGREIEISVLGNENPQVSLPGEIVASHEFYDYEAKYIDDKGAELRIPADLPGEKISEMQELARKAFLAIGAEGMARVDFFYTGDGKFVINELNTIPGFTKISMYPKMWQASGIGYSELIDHLIRLALERFEREQKLKNTH